MADLYGPSWLRRLYEDWRRMEEMKQLTVGHYERILGEWPTPREATMDEQTWLTSADPAAMLRWLTTEPKKFQHDFRLSPRLLRLFACACARQMGHSLADGLLSGAELWADTGEEQYEPSDAVPWPGMRWCYNGDAVDGARRWAEARSIVPQALRAALLRCIVGNPFRPVTLPWEPVEYEARMTGSATVTYGVVSAKGHECPWLAWNDGTVPRMAQAIYDERRWDWLPELADALEEAGCTDAAILGHLRNPGPHARGCHVLGLLLGKD